MDTLSSASLAWKLNVNVSGLACPASAGRVKLPRQVVGSMDTRLSSVCGLRPAPDNRACTVGLVAGGSLKLSVASTVCAGSLLIGEAGSKVMPDSAGPAVSSLSVAPWSISVPRLPTRSRAENNALATPEAVLASTRKLPV